MNPSRYYRRILGSVILGIVAVVVVACGLQRPQAEPLALVIATTLPTALPAPTPTAAPITVFVSGEVTRPGVYTLPPDSRVVDAITAAGGLSTAADASAVNQATALVDGMQIHIPLQGEVATPPAVSVEEGATSESPAKVNINQATAAELETLPGIGPTRAEDIITYREANGGFKSIEELLNVPGIGEATFNDLRDLVTIE